VESQQEYSGCMFKVKDEELGCRIEDLGFRVPGSGFRV
jgi:hypothetical protein